MGKGRGKGRTQTAEADLHSLEGQQQVAPAQKTKAEEEDERFWNVILGLLLFLVCLMLYNELLRHYNHRQQVFWDDHYLAAVRGDANDWKFGFRLEDLEQRILSQRSQVEAEHGVLDKSPHGLLSRIGHQWHHQRHPSRGEQLGLSHKGPHDPSKRRLAAQLVAHVENNSAFRTLSCVARPTFHLRVGPDDFRDVPTDRCQVFSAQPSQAPGAHAVWELVDLGQGAVGLRSLGNGKFLKVAAPKADTWNAAWKLHVVSPLPGLAERFQLRPGPGQGRVKLYSELMHGYVQCSGDGLAEELKGYPAETLYEESDSYHFNLTTVEASDLARLRQLRTASKHVAKVQQQQITTFLALKANAKAMARSPPKGRGYKIALCVPMTSRGTDMQSVDQSPLWFNLYASFMESVDWASNPHEFTFYLGLDRGDPLYDTGDAWAELRGAFSKNTRRAMTWLGYENASVAEDILGRQLKLKLMDFTGTTGAPSQVVVGLVKQAYEDGMDYFFQVNDDTMLVSKGWATGFIETLLSNPVHPNLGITGPVDTNNDRILTHAFAHRTHVEIFDGHFFPPAFKNWWSDDWISTVYGSGHTFRSYDILITHNVQSQKTGAFNRYTVDESAKFALRKELAKGFVTVNKWLVSKKLPRLPLPDVCGYSPLMGELYQPLMEKSVHI